MRLQIITGNSRQNGIEPRKFNAADGVELGGTANTAEGIAAQVAGVQSCGSCEDTHAWQRGLFQSAINEIKVNEILKVMILY